MKKMCMAVIFALICGIAISAVAQEQSYESEESGMASSLDQTMAGEEAQSSENMQEMEASMQGNETATQTY